jgi:predicted enzyme related to lactoylglutathione lyase
LYRMVAERDNETVRFERESALVITAKARVWASEGWVVEIVDSDGKIFGLADPNDVRPSPLTGR